MQVEDVHYQLVLGNKKDAYNMHKEIDYFWKDYCSYLQRISQGDYEYSYRWLKNCIISFGAIEEKMYL